MRFLVVAAIVAPAIAHADRAAESALEEGRRLYDLREWDKAIAKFKDSYKRQPTPAALFNIAQTYRQQGDCKSALGFYKTFLRLYPKEKNRQLVQGLIDEMTKCVEAGTTAVAPKQVEPEPKAEPLPQPTPVVVHHDPHAWMRPTSYVLGGIGLVGLVLGTKFALDGSAAEDDLFDLCATSCTNAQAHALDESGRTANRRAWIATSLGGAALVGGAVLFVLSRRHAPEPSVIGLAPITGGAAVTLTLDLP